MKKTDQIYEALLKNDQVSGIGLTAIEVSERLGVDRANTSRYLNQLYAEGRVSKSDGRPVRYQTKGVRLQEPVQRFSMDMLIGAEKSLSVPIQQAKAAILYPPRGLHTLILGETGVGKSMFAELMYAFACETQMIGKDAPFVRFNCADYAENPQLLVSQIFGVKKGAYTGADKDREGLLKKADGGMLFLDEVHRLSNQGQEMLFTFIDKGYFRKLGDSEEKVRSEVQIIAATTEDPASSLLATFTRRIPMTIHLPNLKERGLKDRYKLIEIFIKEESKRLQKSIYINKLALESFMIYDCPSNIGQLRSDIQLSCAKAFLHFMSQSKTYILIEQGDLPQNVKKGHLLIKQHREALDRLLKHQEDIYKFYYDEDESYLNEKDTSSPLFYETIEKRLQLLKAEGLNPNEINERMSVDIEKHFQTYLTEQVKGDELSGIADPLAVQVAHELLDEASKRLHKSYNEKVYLGLALHLHSSIDRIRSGKKIYHPKLNDIRVNHQDAFLLAMELARVVDAAFEVETPLDEIGYLAMFFATDPFDVSQPVSGGVGIVVVMHGNTTASSMVDVAVELVGATQCVAVDMPLSMKPDAVYLKTKEAVLSVDSGAGVLLLVDMGSLLSFADMIAEETGIYIKSIDRVSTPMLLEATRKAGLGRELMDIYKTTLEMIQTVTPDHGIGKKNLIITACFTGEGASERIKQILMERLAIDESCEIISLNIVNRKEFLNLIAYYRGNYHLLAVVSTVDMPISGVANFSALEVLSGAALPAIKSLLDREDVYSKISLSLEAHLKMAETALLVKHVRNFIEQSEHGLKVSLSQDVKIGIALHLSFLIDNLMQGFASKKNEDLLHYKMQFPMEMSLTRELLWPMAQTFGVAFTDDDVVYLCKMFLSNHDKKSV